MDVKTALESPVAARPLTAADDPPLPCAVRWRRRPGTPGDDGSGAPAAQTRGTTLADSPLPDATPAMPDHAVPGQAHRDAELWQLARRSQGATLRLEFELRTAVVRQVFRRDFVYVARQLHGLEASRRVQGLDRACLNDALASLQQRADDVLALLRSIGADLQARIDASGPAGARLSFARAARFQATVVSPAAHRYLALLTQADDTLARLELAWLLGLVEPATRTGLVGDCRRALHGFKDLASQLRQAVGDQVREVNAQRRHGSGASAAAPDDPAGSSG